MSVVLSEHLPLLITAPEGVRKVRRLILELAVRGRLVPQDPNDEPASELLERMARERTRLEVEGSCKKLKVTSTVGEDEQPFSLPKSWVWTRLTDVYFSISPSSNKLLSSEIQKVGTIPVVDQGKRFIAGYTDDASLVIRIPGPVVVFGDHTTERKYVDFDFVAGADGVKILRPILQDEKFFFRQLQSFNLEERGYARHFKVLNDQLYALPPLAEQHRIVAKVDELMTFCDQLETQQAEAESARTKLVDTLLSTLTQSSNAADLAKNWSRLSEHFGDLFITESSLDSLRQTVLQLAVMGKLVPQDPKDEPASELLKQMAHARTGVEAKDSGKKSRATPATESDGLPSGWSMATLPELCEIGGGATPSKAKSAYWGQGIPWVSPKDMKVEYIHDAQDHVTDLALNETRLPRISSSSLLIVVRGMILVHSFPVATTQVEVAINQDMKALTPFMPEVLPYLALALKGWRQQILALVDRSTHGTCKLQSEKLFAFQIGIPPLAEQHRIITKVDELMALCDRFKADLVESCDRQTQLASTLIEVALKAV